MQRWDQFEFRLFNDFENLKADVEKECQRGDFQCFSKPTKNQKHKKSDTNMAKSVSPDRKGHKNQNSLALTQ